MSYDAPTLLTPHVFFLTGLSSFLGFDQSASPFISCFAQILSISTFCLCVFFLFLVLCFGCAQ